MCNPQKGNIQSCVQYTWYMGLCVIPIRRAIYSLLSSTYDIWVYLYSPLEGNIQSVVQSIWYMGLCVILIKNVIYSLLSSTYDTLVYV